MGTELESTATSRWATEQCARMWTILTATALCWEVTAKCVYGMGVIVKSLSLPAAYECVQPARVHTVKVSS